MAWDADTERVMARNLGASERWIRGRSQSDTQRSNTGVERSETTPIGKASVYASRWRSRACEAEPCREEWKNGECQATTIQTNGQIYSHPPARSSGAAGFIRVNPALDKERLRKQCGVERSGARTFDLTRQRRSDCGGLFETRNENMQRRFVLFVDKVMMLWWRDYNREYLKRTFADIISLEDAPRHTHFDRMARRIIHLGQNRGQYVKFVLYE